MKILVLSLLSLFATVAFAASGTEGQITMSSPAPTGAASANSNLTEASMQYSSINNGSLFATVGLMHEFDNGFALGVRGYVPMQYTNQDDAFMAQLAARFILLNDINQMYVEAALTQGFFNDPNATTAFAMVGVDYGFVRRITSQISVGGVLGVDYSPTRIAQDSIGGGATFYNKIGVVGSYYF